ncbi:MAG: RNA methyltransferase [Flavobacteriaceae bacterium]
MVSKNQIKLIQQLHQKKYRNLHNLFIVEGEKGVSEFLEASFELHFLFHTENFVLKKHYDEAVVINDKELRKISQLKTPNKVLAIFKKPLEARIQKKGLTVVLDNVQDPGNLGTIIRLSDWFKVTQIICATETVDCYNAKVVQATMGSLARVPIIYTDIFSFLNNTKLACFAAIMDGENVYEKQLPQDAVLVMGNEANGISSRVLKTIDSPLAIPRFNNTSKPESLNVATATAILLSEFRR